MGPFQFVMIKEQVGLWTVTVVAALSPLLGGGTILYLTGDDPESWWQKNLDVVGDGGLFIITATILATALATAKTGAFKSNYGRIAAGLLLVFILLSTVAWSYTEFGEGADPSRVEEVSLYLFIGGLLLGFGLVIIGSIESAVSERECKALRETLTQLMAKSEALEEPEERAVT